MPVLDMFQRVDLPRKGRAAKPIGHSSGRAWCGFQGSMHVPHPSVIGTDYLSEARRSPLVSDDGEFLFGPIAATNTPTPPTAGTTAGTTGPQRCIGTRMYCRGLELAYSRARFLAYLYSRTPTTTAATATH